MAGVEMAFDRRAHDSPGLTLEGSRAGAKLQIRKQRLLPFVEREQRLRNRNVFGGAGAAARLRVEQRRLNRERGRSAPALLIDVRAQLLVILDRHAFSESGRIRDVGETVRSTEPRIAIGRQQLTQDLALCGV